MGISISGNNSSSTLLSMMSSSKQTSADSIFAANIQANRERVNKAIEKVTKVSMTTDTEKYEKVAEDAKETEKLLEALKEPELYQKESAEVDKVVTKFTEEYNNFITDVSNLGGNIKSTYSPKLTEVVKKNVEVLNEIGIEVDNSGKLKKKETAIKPVEVDKVKSVFTEKDGLGESTKSVLTDVSDILSKALKIKQAQTTNYAKSGLYSNSYVNSILNAQI